MSSKRVAALVGALAVAGIAISGYIAYVHRQIAAEAAPSCDVSEVFSCTTVLSSSYAYLPGKIPVAYVAIAAYLLFGLAALAMARALPKMRQRGLVAGGIFAAAVFSAVYSMFLAGVAVFELEAVCLLCSGLYVVNAAMVVAAALLVSAVRREASRGREDGAGLVRWVLGGAAAGLVGVVGLIGWEASVGATTTVDPDFERWYRALPSVEQPPTNGHAKGPADSAVVIAEFSDFECGHCAKVYKNIKAVLPRFSKDVRVEFHHYPLDSACNPSMSQSFHRNACLAAFASECAAQQDKFWPYHDLLFDNQQELDRENLLSFAQRVGLDRDAFSSCLESSDVRDAVARDVAEGARLQVTSTPTLIINNRVVRGALDTDKLASAIRIERNASTQRN